MSKMQLVNTVIPFVPFVVLGNYPLLMRTAQRIEIQFGDDFKILKVRFIPACKKVPNIAENSDRNLVGFFSVIYSHLKSEVISKRKSKML